MNCNDEHLYNFLERTGHLLIYLTNQCNLFCSHCFLGASPNGKEELSLSLIQRTLDEAHQLGIKSVQFTGGEPLLYQNLREVLESTKGKKFSITLSTNGTLSITNYIPLLIQTNARVVVSIDGPPEYHDHFRGLVGSFGKTTNNIRQLIEAGIPVHVVMTICKDNYDFIEWCAEWALKARVQRLQLQPLEGVGRAKSIANKQLDNDKNTDLFLKTSDIASKYLTQGLSIKMTYKSKAFMMEHPCTAYICNGKDCHRGIDKELKKIIIRESGIILPELEDIDHKYSIGNIHKDTLKNNLLHYLNNGYDNFDKLCRNAYAKHVVPNPSPLISWDEILTNESKKSL